MVSFLIWKVRRRPEVKGLALGGMIAVFNILLHSISDFNLQIPANAATFVVILAMGWHVRWLGHHARARHRPTAIASVAGPAEVVSLPQERAPAKA